MSDTDPPETSRDMDTNPLGLEPPSEFSERSPDDIQGAPPYMRTLFSTLDKTHKNTDRMVADMRIIRKQFVSFRDEARMRFRSLEEQVGDLEERAESGEINLEEFAAGMHDLRLQFDELKRKVEPYLEGK